jgi:hypothetical protein
MDGKTLVVGMDEGYQCVTGLVDVCVYIAVMIGSLIWDG